MSLLARIRRKLRLPRRVRFKREGRYFVIICIGVGFAAINTGNNLLYLILGWMLSVIVASGILSEQALRNLKLTRRLPGPVFAGRPFLMDITLRNNKRLLPSFSIQVQDILEERPVQKKCYFLKLGAGRTQTASYQHTLDHRGLHEFTGCRIGTEFPFGLVVKSRDMDALGEVLVYPRIYPVTLPPSTRQQVGEETRARLGRHGEYFGLREFRQGDDRRNVHWRSSARTGKLLVREYEQESHRLVTVFVDNALPKKASTAQKEDLERAISLAASLAVAYLRKNYTTRLVARGTQIPAGIGPAQQSRILKALALLSTTSPDEPFAAQHRGAAHNILVTRIGCVAADAPPGVHVLTVEEGGLSHPPWSDSSPNAPWCATRTGDQRALPHRTYLASSTRNSDRSA